MEDPKQLELKENKQKLHPKTQSNFLSHFFFCWEIPIIWKGWRQESTEDNHLYKPLKEYESKKLTDKFEQLWEDEERFSKTPSLLKCIIKQFGFEYLLLGLMYAPFQIAVTLLQPYFIKKLLDYYTKNQNLISRQQAYFYAGTLGLTACIRVVIYHFFTFNATVIGMKVRIACSSLIYRRALIMKKTIIDKITLGQLVNLLSNDVTRFDQVSPYLHFIWIGVLELIVAIYYMKITVGYAALGGIIILFLCLTIQVIFTFQISKCRVEVAEKTDYRIRLMNDIICGIEAIKMYTWEKAFVKLVELCRLSELRKIKIATNYRLFINAFKVYMGKLAVFVSVVTAVLLHKNLTSQYAFSLISVYESLKLSTAVFLPLAAIMYAEAKISIQRIQEFLLINYEKPKNLTKILKPANLKQDSCFLKLHQDLTAKPIGILLQNICVKWDPSNSTNILDSVNLEASPGDLIGIIGSAGSGKSTLLQVILKEIDCVKGKLEVNGLVSYASQEAWIFPSSIRQNILFGETFDLEKYQKVVRVCGLERDLTLFPYGDQTLVGERGVMLSGGQKARINLARAVYKNSDIILLDDPLSAVDAHVARHIYEECISSYLKDKIVILVTHQVHFLQTATRIYQLSQGGITKSGSYQDVISSTNQLAETNISSEAPPTSLVKTDHNLREEIKEEKGGTKNKEIYKYYCLAAGSWIFTISTLLFFAFGQIFTSFHDLFLTFWTNIEQKSIEGNVIGNFFTTENCLYIYIIIAIMAILFNHLAAYIFTNFCISASRNLHQKMLSKIIYGPMSFFNHNPSGRLLNRFSKDLGCIDELLSIHLMNGITVITTGTAIILIIVVLNNWMILPSIILISLTVFITVVFQPTNRNIKRTEGITRSSIFTHMSTSIQGLATIRAHNLQDQLKQEFDNHQNTHSSAFYLFTATFASFGFWADLIAVIYTILVIFSFFLLKSGAYAGNVGLAITQSITLLGMIQYGVKTFGELDSQMTSVERVVEYANLKLEEDTGSLTPPELWPSTGEISFDKITLKYSSDEPPVLKQISFEVSPGEKIGIVGRTGAGKTSLISILFRLFDFDGSVVIDKINTKSIPLNDLRSKISIIPQEPILFLGSLRKNIDPFDEYSDSQLWSILEELKLKEMIENLPSGLESLVSERGSNFSVGQRQLLCLIRATLRQNKIIILDEATANVDLETDELIQNVIRKKFKNATVLTIAHRLKTILDSDKILVMDNGQVVEFGSPNNLLQNTDGYFYGLAQKSGNLLKL